MSGAVYASREPRRRKIQPNARPTGIRRRNPSSATVAASPNVDPLALSTWTRAKKSELRNSAPFQPIERDFAFVVDRGVRAADLVRAAQSADKKLVTDVTVFDVYEGEGIAPGKKSIAIAVKLQAREKTLTDAEIDAVATKIVDEVGKRTGGVLRA